MSAVITFAMLKAARACTNQLALFNATFGDSVDVSRKTVAVALAAGVNVSWAGGALLRGKFKQAYDAAKADASKAYYAARRANASKAFNAAMADANNAYNAVMADAFADAYIVQRKSDEVTA